MVGDKPVHGTSAESRLHGAYRREIRRVRCTRDIGIAYGVQGDAGGSVSPTPAKKGEVNEGRSTSVDYVKEDDSQGQRATLSRPLQCEQPDARR
jgi:hypothetical protein